MFNPTCIQYKNNLKKEKQTKMYHIRKAKQKARNIKIWIKNKEICGPGKNVIYLEPKSLRYFSSKKKQRLHNVKKTFKT